MNESHGTPVADLSAAGVLREMKAARAAAWAAETRLLELAGHWADLHPAESMESALGFTNREVGGSYAEREEPIAGPGVPEVAEFAISEVGAVLGTTTTAAKRLIGHAQELRMRLPKTWARVRSGTVAPWKARRVAEVVIHSAPALTPAALAYVDGQVACRAGLVGPRVLDRLMEEALLRFDLVAPPAVDQDGCLVDEDPGLRVDFDEQRVGFHGTMTMTAVLELGDALDLNEAITQAAAALGGTGSAGDSLEARRARALGHIARSFLAGGTGAGEAGAGVGRQLVLNLHLTATHSPDGIGLDPVVRLDEGQRTLAIDQVMAWCGASNTRVKIQPIPRPLGRTDRAGLPAHRHPAPADQAPRHHLRLPLLHPSLSVLRRRPRRTLRPRPAGSRADPVLEPGLLVSTPPPVEDLQPLAGHHTQPRLVHLDQPTRPHLDPITRRNHRRGQAAPGRPDGWVRLRLRRPGVPHRPRRHR